MEQAALCADPAQHGMQLSKLDARVKAIEEKSASADAHLKEVIDAQLAQIRSEIDTLRNDLHVTDKKADRILELTIQIERLTGQIAQLEGKVESLLSSRKLGFTTIFGIIQSIITTAVLVWLGLH